MSSFAMYLIDIGKADACALGWLSQWINSVEYDEFARALHDMKQVVPLEAFGHPKVLPMLLMWIYPDEWRTWRTIQRVLG